MLPFLMRYCNQFNFYKVVRTVVITTVLSGTDIEMHNMKLTYKVCLRSCGLIECNKVCSR